VILIDANIFMYAAGADHPNKEPSRVFLERVAEGEIEAGKPRDRWRPAGGVHGKNRRRGAGGPRGREIEPVVA
jgi:hypothetical protein